MQVQAGTARRVITPPKGIYLIGYADRTGGNVGVRDELYATSLVLSSGGEYEAIVCLDLLGINREVAERIQARVAALTPIKPEAVFLNCSHTHSGPVSWAPETFSLSKRLLELSYRPLMLLAGRRQPSGWAANKRYIDTLVENAASSVRDAFSRLSNAELFKAEAELDIGINRREETPDGIRIGMNPGGVIDRTARILAVQTKDQYSVLVNHNCHGVFFGPGNYLVSSDWIGEMRKRVEEKTGGLCLYLQGATGNINPNALLWSGRNESEMIEAGAKASESVLDAVSKARPLKAGRLALRNAVVEIRLDYDARLTEREVRVNYKKELARFGGLPVFIAAPALHFRYPWKVEMKKIGGVYHTPIYVSSCSLGEWALAAVSMEPFAETGLKIKASSPFPFTMIAGYTNGLSGYLPTAKAREEGGYEVQTGPYLYTLPGLLEKDAEEKVVQALLALLAESV